MQIPLLVLSALRVALTSMLAVANTLSVAEMMP
jgi:hypothetical protein